MFRWPLLILALPCAAIAQIPTIDRIESENLTPGKVAQVTAFGKGLKNVAYLWTPVGSLASQPPAAKPDETRAVFEGTLPETLEPGIYEARVVTTQGVSARQYLVVDHLPSFRLPDACEVSPPKTKLPAACSINGHINALKPKFFGIDLKKDQPLSVAVVARRLDSSLDPVLRISDSSGRELAFADDTPGLAGDAELTFTPPADGTYTIELHDVRYSGGGSHFYHLRVGGSPLPTTSLHNSSLAAMGVAPESSQTEQEPNDSQSEANPIPAAVQLVNGTLETGDSVDWYEVTADAPQPLCVTAYTRQLGSPADIVLTLVDADGKTLKTDDDTGPGDAQLTHPLPSAGRYFLSVKELSGQSGPSWQYALQVERHGRIEATTAVDSIAIPKSGTASVTVTVKQLGRSAPFEILASDLPPGIQSSPVVVGPQQKTAVLTLQSTTDAADTFQHPIQLQARSSADGSPIPILYAPPAKPVTDAAYTVPRLQTGTFTYATAPAPFSLQADPMSASVAKGAEVAITVSAGRTGDWTQPIDLASAIPAAELPAGITVAAAKLEKDSAQITVQASDKAVPGRYSLSLQGTLKKDKTTIVQPLPTVTLEVVEAVKTVAQEPAP